MHMVSKLHSLKMYDARAPNPAVRFQLFQYGADSRCLRAALLDVIRGDQSLLVGREEVEESWRWRDALIEAWRTQGVEVKGHRAGSNGPTRAELLIENDGRSWHES